MALALALAPAFVSGTADVPDDAIRQRVDAIFVDVDRKDTPGCVLGVMRDGAVLYARAFGMADLEHAVPLTTTSVLELASESKQFTAAAVLLAVEDGKISLDDDVREYVPELPDDGRKITIHHLLHHTSGLRDYITLQTMSGRSPLDLMTAAEVLDVLARQEELNFVPGSEYSYSNSGYFLLGLVVERALGTSLRDFSWQRIFEPLGMKATHYGDDHTEIVENRAAGHVRTERGFGRSSSQSEIVGPGGLWTTLEDLLAWNRSFDENSLGNGTLVAALTTRGRLDGGERLHYARGLVVDDFDGLTTVSHGGVGNGYSAYILRIPQLRFSVSCLCNATRLNVPGRVWRTAVLYLYGPFAEETRKLQHGTSEPEFLDVPPERLRAAAGAWRDPMARAIWKVAVQEGGLVIDTGGSSFFVRPVGGDRYRTPGPGQTTAVAFLGGDAGESRRMVVEFEAAPAATFTPATLVDPERVALHEYAGSYYSDELRVPWVLVLRGGALYFDERDDVAFVPTIRDEFAWGPDLIVSFERDAAQRIIALVAHTDRVRALRFERMDTGRE